MVFKAWRLGELKTREYSINSKRYLPDTMFSCCLVRPSTDLALATVLVQAAAVAHATPSPEHQVSFIHYVPLQYSIILQCSSMKTKELLRRSKTVEKLKNREFTNIFITVFGHSVSLTSSGASQTRLGQSAHCSSHPAPSCPC